MQHSTHDLLITLPQRQKVRRDTTTKKPVTAMDIMLVSSVYSTVSIYSSSEFTTVASSSGSSTVFFVSVVVVVVVDGAVVGGGIVKDAVGSYVGHFGP